MSPFISFQSVWRSGMRYHVRITHQLTQKHKWWKKNGNEPLFLSGRQSMNHKWESFLMSWDWRESKVPVCSSGPSGKLRMCEGFSSFVMGRRAVYTMFPEWKKQRCWIFIATRPPPSPGRAYRMKNHTTSPFKTQRWILFPETRLVIHSQIIVYF